MKFTSLSTRLGLLVVLAMPAGQLLQAQPSKPSHYSVTDLGTLPGGDFSQATNVSDNRLVTGLSSVADGTQHALFWWGPFRIDIGAPGVNSGAFGINARGQASVQSEVADKDPNNENFCAYGTGRKCLAFRWQQGVMTLLPTLGGNNATVGNINSRGEIPGLAETNMRDQECPSGVSVNGVGPLLLDYRGVIWGPGPNDVRELHPLPGDTVSMAIWMNDNGQAVGGSGRCGNTLPPPIAVAPHAVLWERDGTVVDLGNLGGSVNTSILGVGNIGLAINNPGEVTGAAAIPDGTHFHAFLWTKQAGKMRDLGTLPGDVDSAGTAINDRGQVVGGSTDPDGNVRAYVWQDGVMSDLNSLVVSGSQLHLLLAFGINSSGEIAGFGVNSHGDVRAFLATPVYGMDDKARTPAALPENLRAILEKGASFGRLRITLPRPK